MSETVETTAAETTSANTEPVAPALVAAAPVAPAPPVPVFIPKTPALIVIHDAMRPEVVAQANIHNQLETELAQLDPNDVNNAVAIKAKTTLLDEARRLFNVLGGFSGHVAADVAKAKAKVHPFLKRMGVTSVADGVATVGGSTSGPHVVEPVEQVESVEPAEINQR